MGIYLRLLPGVKVRVTRRGVRWGLGPRAAGCTWAAVVGGVNRRRPVHLVPAAAAAQQKVTMRR
jgi:hypothetical protein